MAYDIQHIFVLMLENRSFNHFLGFCGIEGVEGAATTMSNPDKHASPAPLSCDAPDWPTADPNHEYCDVQLQIFGNRTPAADAPSTMQGFVKSCDNSVMKCFTPQTLPILNQLAREFTICDHWFSPMPGPTWPNRFFVHAASSGGLDNSPSDAHSAIAATFPGWWGFEFQNGTIYDRLNAADLPWRVYHGDCFPQVLAIKDLVRTFVNHSGEFDTIIPDHPDDPFKTDLMSKESRYNAAYTFIEPNYGLLSKGKEGNSQHAMGSASAGEAFIKYVYETIRNSPIWEQSVLVVTYDEHGGFFDHVAPCPCEPPGDNPVNHEQAQYPKNCAFDHYGVRVPAVIVSPWIRQGRAWHTPTDHTTIIRTIRDIFPQLEQRQLTDRDGSAPSFVELFEAELQRRDGDATAAPKVLSPIAQIANAAAPLAKVVSMKPVADDMEPIDNELSGFSRIAADVQRVMEESTPKTPPNATQLRLRFPGVQFPGITETVESPTGSLTGSAKSGGVRSKESLEATAAVATRLPKLNTQGDARKYIKSVLTQMYASRNP